MIVDFIGGSAAQASVRSAAIVPGEIERQLVPESLDTVRDQDQAADAFDLQGSDASFDDCQASILTDGS
jgi:hypothetical protein